jgi:ribosomal protein S18 acetylase RimI-like enzyme
MAAAGPEAGRFRNPGGRKPGGSGSRAAGIRAVPESGRPESGRPEAGRFRKPGGAGSRAVPPGGNTWHTLAPVRRPDPPRELSLAGFMSELDQLTAVYAAAMRPDPGQLPSRRAAMERHASYRGFRALAVTAGAAAQAGGRSEPGQIIGFSYGFTGADGQWWHDVVAAALTATAGAAGAGAWLADSLEIAEVHVHPDFHRRGIGRSLVAGLAAGRQERTAVLSTQDANTPARRLYCGLGFADLLTGYSFPGSGVPYAVMGAVLPLRPASAPPAPGTPGQRRTALPRPSADTSA